MIALANNASIKLAANYIKSGELVIFPTETVYGLGADATNNAAIEELYEIKNRPGNNPLIIHISTIDDLAKISHVTPSAMVLAKTFWPGPLTLVLRRKLNSGIVADACSGLDTIAIRMPHNKVALDLIRLSKIPIAAPSANPSGRTSPTTAEHASSAIGNKVAMILDGGACRIGIESTVISLVQDPPLLLRPGDITVDEIEALIGSVNIPDQRTETAPSSPGRATSHYAPSLPVRLNAMDLVGDEALLAFGANTISKTNRVLNLSPDGSLEEAAANLYKMLIELDNPKYSGIAVMSIPNKGLGLAINDRLNRAAAKRS